MSESLLDITRQVRDGSRTAASVIDTTIRRIEEHDPRYNSFTLHTFARARAQAAELDAARARGERLPPLAGVPFAVKNLYDIRGEVTIAGAKVNRDRAPAQDDSVLVARLSQAGAVLMGALNMDEHAYGFTTENTHYGATLNPHDLGRIAGGSSGGSGAAVAAGLVPLTLGSDTNGSIRVPASLCGVYGLKPTFGRLSRRGTFPFVGSLDHLGHFARHVGDLALAYDMMQGQDPADPACAQRSVDLISDSVCQGLPAGCRVAVLGGYFDDFANEPARQAVRMAAQALRATDTVTLPGAELARAAAFIITGAEGGALHRTRLLAHYDDYEPASRDRLVAGSLIPANWVAQAQRIRRRVFQQALALFEQYDVLIAPATPVAATPIGADSVTINGQTLPSRASMGLLTQPISCIGLPVCTAPLWPAVGDDRHLPVGVQLIAAPWRELDAMAAARSLEMAGLAYAREI